jgi:protein-glutamine gamma-glutamyltransferase
VILINGSPLDVSLIAGEYPENSVQRRVLEQMSISPEKYRYGDTDQLRFELDMRNEIVNAARALSRSGLRFAVFRRSAVNPDYWDRTDNGGFRLKRGVKASEAIKDIYKNGQKYATECATAMVIVYYGAILRMLPEETFNSFFRSVYLMNWHRLDPLLREVGTPARAADIMPGDRGYFRNPDVDPETPELQGENVIVLPRGVFYGHGIGIATSGSIIRFLNENRREGAERSAYFMDTAARPDFMKLYGTFRNTGERAAARSA